MDSRRSQSRSHALGPAAPTPESLFESQAANRPDLVALVGGGQSVSYNDLAVWTGRLARALRDGRRIDRRPVVLIMRSGPRAVAAHLAVLRAGATFVCVDDDLPAVRIHAQLDDVRPDLIVQDTDAVDAHRTIAGWCASTGAVSLSFEAWDAAAESADTAHTADPSLPAYIAYTSGSTGEPKGIVMPRDVLARFLTAWVGRVGIRPGDRIAQWAPLSYDAAYAEIFGGFAAGATICYADQCDRADAESVLTWLKESDISVLQTVPAFLRELVECAGTGMAGALPALRAMLVAGEVLSVDLASAFRRRWPGVRLFNLYGPSESILATAMPVDEILPDWKSIPIGIPLDGRRILVLDDSGAVCPPGVTGELFVGGDCLAWGYWRRPAETASAFVPDPTGPRRGARLYRTGDLVRYLSDGYVEFVGRRDFQLKLRGRRVEPAEIEAALRRHCEVADAVVTAVDAERLVAHVVPATPDAPPDPDRLRRYLRERLPEYMVPAGYSILDRLPVTRTGKVDRATLGEGGLATAADAALDPPRSAAQRQVAEAFGRVLGVARVGVRSNFFELGGHSLLAARVASRLRTRFGIDVSVRTVLEFPTVEALSTEVEARIQGHNGGEATVDPSVGPARASNPRILSSAQRRLWFLQQLDPDGCGYNMLLGIRLRGSLDRPALERSLVDLLDRHEVLRTSIEEGKGGPIPVVRPATDLRLRWRDLDGLAPVARKAELVRQAADSAMVPFDLARELPIRVSAVQLGVEEHALLVTLHHVAGDARSIEIIRRDLSELYEARRRRAAPRLEPLSEQYADYAAWQRELMRGPAGVEDLNYWIEQLSGLQPLELPTDRPRGASDAGRGDTHHFVVPAELAARVRAVGLEAGTTPFMTLLAAFVVLLSRYSGQRDISVGVPVTGRHRPQDEDLVGCFVNTLVFRADLDHEPSFRDLLARIRRVALDAYKHQHVPLERLVEHLAPERDLSRNPLFQVMLDVRGQQETQDHLGELSAERLDIDLPVSIVDLLLTLSESVQHGMRGKIQYNADLFDASTIEALGRHFLGLLSDLAANLDQPIGSARMLGPAERDGLLHQSGGRRSTHPPQPNLHGLFEAQAAQSPDSVAIVCGTEQIRYGELDAAASRLAEDLRRRGSGPEQPVGLLMPAGIPLVVAVLGILKAGSAYLPLGADDPAGRLSDVLNDAGARLVVTTAGLRSRLDHCGVAVLTAGEDTAAEAEAAGGPAAVAARDAAGAGPASLAYLIYTSGSSGRPNAVAVEHASITRYTVNAAALFETTSTDRVYQFATMTADTHAEEIYPALCSGASMVIRSPDAVASVAHLLADVARHRVTVLNLPTAYWHEVCAALAAGGGSLPSSVRLVVIGGEKASPAALSTWRGAVDPAVRLLNTYGPTEATVAVCAADLTHEPTGPGVREVPIGRPFGAAAAHVLDDHLEPVPTGVEGELYLGGPCLARGYLHRPAATAARFVPDPHSGGQGGRLFRTGDLARRRRDGLIELVGRADDQTKIRGYRVEPGEIESLLRTFPGIVDIAVVAANRPTGTALIGYVVFRDEKAATAGELRLFLAQRLPPYMLPSEFVSVARLPRTAQGKVDRRSLSNPDPGQRLPAGREHVTPKSRLESAVADIWCQVLGRDDVGTDDNVFDLGAHSFMLTRVAARIHHRFGLTVPLPVFFERPTVGQLTQHIEGGLGQRITRMTDADVHRLLGGSAVATASVQDPQGERES